MSGRKGQGVKADDLLDTLESEAKKEVVKRNPELTPSKAETIARQIAVGALRYFLLKFTRTAIIAFDFKEALNFDGETGPYHSICRRPWQQHHSKTARGRPVFRFRPG